MPKIVVLYADAMQSGKSTAAQQLVMCNYTPVAFASPLKRMVGTLLQQIGLDDTEIEERIYGSQKEEIIPAIGVSARRLMQTLGSEWGRSVDENLWVKIATSKILAELDRGQNVVIDDCRFLNEAQALKDLGATFIKIVRPGVKVTATHASEGGLATWKPDAVIFNDGSVEDLWVGLMRVLTELEADAH